MEADSVLDRVRDGSLVTLWICRSKEKPRINAHGIVYSLCEDPSGHQRFMVFWNDVAKVDTEPVWTTYDLRQEAIVRLAVVCY